MTPFMTILVFFLRGVPHQFVDQRQRLLVLHADDGFLAWLRGTKLARRTIITKCEPLTSEPRRVGRNQSLKRFVAGSSNISLARARRGALVLHPAGREAERSELKRAFCSSLSEL
jgi:hypothetical protein